MTAPTATEWQLAVSLNEARRQHANQHAAIVDQLGAVLNRKRQADVLEKLHAVGSDQCQAMRERSAHMAASVLSELQAAIELTGEVLANVETKLQVWKQRN